MVECVRGNVSGNGVGINLGDVVTEEVQISLESIQSLPMPANLRLYTLILHNRGSREHASNYPYGIGWHFGAGGNLEGVTVEVERTLGVCGHHLWKRRIYAARKGFIYHTICWEERLHRLEKYSS